MHSHAHTRAHTHTRAHAWPRVLHTNEISPRRVPSLLAHTLANLPPPDVSPFHESHSLTDDDFLVAKAEYIVLREANQAKLAAGGGAKSVPTTEKVGGI
jgi:hypothetical protein